MVYKPMMFESWMAEHCGVDWVFATHNNATMRECWNHAVKVGQQSRNIAVADLEKQLAAALSRCAEYSNDVDFLNSNNNDLRDILENFQNFLDYSYKVFELYGNRCTYEAERTGGVLAGCPRGKPPSPDSLVFEARYAMKRLHEVQGKEVPDWVEDSGPSLFTQLAEMKQQRDETASEFRAAWNEAIKYKEQLSGLQKENEKLRDENVRLRAALAQEANTLGADRNAVSELLESLTHQRYSRIRAALKEKEDL